MMTLYMLKIELMSNDPNCVFYVIICGSQEDRCHKVHRHIHEEVTVHAGSKIRYSCLLVSRFQVLSVAAPGLPV